MLSNYSCTDTSIGDHLNAKKMDEETEMEGDGGCCRHLERGLEAGLSAIQLEIEKSK